jgi:hypothetical protein
MSKPKNLHWGSTLDDLLAEDHFDWLIAAARRTFRASDTTPVVIDAVRRAEMDAAHAHLDDLMK